MLIRPCPYEQDDPGQTRIRAQKLTTLNSALEHLFDTTRVTESSGSYPTCDPNDPDASRNAARVWEPAKKHSDVSDLVDKGLAERVQVCGNVNAQGPSEAADFLTSFLARTSEKRQRLRDLMTPQSSPTSRFGSKPSSAAHAPVPSLQSRSKGEAAMGAVSLKLILDQDITTIGAEGSERRAAFIVRFAEDLACCAGISTRFIRARRLVTVGSSTVAVDVDVCPSSLHHGQPPLSPKDLERRIRDSQAVLRAGNVTSCLSHLKTISSVPSACTQHPLQAASAPVAMDQTVYHPPTIQMDGASSQMPQYDFNSRALQERVRKLEAELAREKMRGHSAVQEELAALQQRMAAEYSQLLQAQRREHEQAVQHLISLIGDRQVQDALDVYQSASKTLEGRKVKRQDTPLF